MTRPRPRYQPGDRIGGRYQVHKALMGGMAEVYLCLDLEENYPYALKTFQQRYQFQDLRKAFEREVTTWMALERHPNIVYCHWMQILDNQPFMCLDWIAREEGKGADLRGWLHYGPLDLQTALEITLDIVRGLLHAQEKQPGLAHCDLKPENVLVAQGGLAKITDFGLAQIVASAGLEVEGDSDGRQSMIYKGGIAGTPAYMAPEQWRGEVMGEQTDIYAVGCILYEMLTGKWPVRVDFIPTTPNQFQQWLNVMQAQHESKNPVTWPDELPSTVSGVISDCLAKIPGDRPTGVAVLAERLERVYQQHFNRPPPNRPHTHAFSAGDYNNRGLTYNNLKRHEAALADYKRAIELDPTYAPAYSNRGNTYQALQQYEAALADYKRAIELDPTYTTAYSNRGNIYKVLQQYEAALADFNWAIKLDPSYTPAYFNRGTTYHELQQYDTALADYRRAIKLSPTYAPAYSNRGNTYQALQQYKAALADFNWAIKLDPSLTQAYFNRGITYHTLQQYDAALADYGRAIELDPTYAPAYLNRGTTYHKLQQYDTALADYGRAIELDPSFAQAYSNRGNTYDDLQQYDAALADYERAIELDPSFAQAYFNLGALLANTGQLRESLPFLEQAAKIGHSSASQAIARIRQMLGQSATAPQPDPIETAFEAFQQAVSLETMQQAVAQFPFMAQLNFISAIEQVITQQVPAEHRAAFDQRLAWLKQIAKEQPQ